MKVRREDVKRVIEKLKEAGGKEEKAPPGVTARLRFEDGLVQIYHTGSITFGGKEREKVRDRVERVIGELVAGRKEFPVIGCDEAGKGEFLGPLVVACVWTDREGYLELLKLGLRDSKKLSREKIEELAEKIRKICHGRVRVLMPEEYNRLYRKFRNQNRLLEEVYAGILKELLNRRKAELVVVDRFSGKVEERLKREFPGVRFRVVTGGENEPVVAAAAIVAKAERLKRLRELSEKLGIELKEGNTDNRELLKIIPPEERYRFVKEHFKVEDGH